MEKWNRKYDKCQDCGTTERKYYALGKCRLCYYKQQHQRERIKAYRKEWRKTHPKSKAEIRRSNMSYYYRKRKELVKKRMEKYYAKKLLNETRSARVSISNMIERPES